MAALPLAPVSPATDPRPMTKADICNIEPLRPEDEIALRGPEALSLTDDQLRLIEDFRRVGEALKGVLDLCGMHRPEWLAEGHVSFTDGRYYEDGMPPVEFGVDWCTDVDECGGDVAATVIEHLKWNLEQHQELLELATQRLRDTGLVGDDVRFTLTEGGER